MASKFSEAFYRSKQWRSVRLTYLSRANGLCEICYARGEYKPAIDIHHKILLTPNNILDPNVSLNPVNLIALCKECHAEQHQYGGAMRSDVAFDDNGRLISRDDTSVGRYKKRRYKQNRKKNK